MSSSLHDSSLLFSSLPWCPSSFSLASIAFSFSLQIHFHSNCVVLSYLAKAQSCARFFVFLSDVFPGIREEQLRSLQSLTASHISSLPASVFPRILFLLNTERSLLFCE